MLADSIGVVFLAYRMNRYLISSLLSLSVLLVACAQRAGQEPFKAGAPEDPAIERKHNFGSIWPNKEKFFKNGFKKTEDTSKEIVASKTKTSSENQTASKKDKSWDAALKVLKTFSIEYADKSAGVLKTVETRVPEFGSTDSCSYVIKVQIPADGTVKAEVQSAKDSAARLNHFAKIVEQRIVDMASH